MDLELKGKKALVTGSSSGIGAAIAAELAAEGVDVAVHGLDRAGAEETARAVEEKGVKAVITCCGDLTKDEDAAAVARDALEGLGQVDILVNNVGALVRLDHPDWMDVTPQDWVKSYNLNVVASVRMVQLLVPAMRKRGWGRVINISSTAGTQLRGLNLDYAAPKAAVDAFTVNLSKKIAPDGVTVNAVIPGSTLTPGMQRWLAVLHKERGWPDDLEETERLYTRDFEPQPIPRIGRPRHIAVAVAYLASPLAGHTTGAFIRVDGGTANHSGG